MTTLILLQIWGTVNLCNTKEPLGGGGDPLLGGSEFGIGAPIQRGRGGIIFRACQYG
jgi:hypothetical protein